MQCTKKNSLYLLGTRVVTWNVETINDDDATLWHLRLAHVSETNMNVLLKEGLLQRKANLS